MAASALALMTTEKDNMSEQRETLIDRCARLEAMADDGFSRCDKLFFQCLGRAIEAVKAVFELSDEEIEANLILLLDRKLA